VIGEHAPTPASGLWRGLRRRCARCGERGIFDGWFRLKERCPRCGYRFVREEGSFTGVYLLNFGVTEAFMFVVLMAYVLWRGISGSHAAVWPLAVGCGVFAIVAPIVFYPIAASTWAAIDLLTRPLDPDEELDAARHARVSE
jgi:uncharacterized protein (DUF983 family)